MGRLDGRVALVTGAGRRAVMTPEYRAKRIGELPVRHLGQVEDVAYCSVFLAAEEANYLTGQVLQPNGGWAMA
jgi:3-oxoacyl-[acyl-carrier protein] reductase